MDRTRAAPEAIAELERAAEMDPASAEAQSALGAALAAAGRRADAIRRFRAAIALDPALAKAHANLGTALLQENDVDGAIASLEEARRLNPGSHLAHANLGNALRARGDVAGAIASYRRALAVKPDYLPALNNLGNLLAASDPAGAVACLREALRLKPDAPEILVNLGGALGKRGEHDEARACFERAIERAPASPEAHNGLGSALHALGRTGEAIAAYERALSLRPDFYEACSNLGAARQDIGDLSAAIADYRRALALRPSAPQAHNNLGCALKDLGRAAEALACFREALRLDPAVHEAWSNLLLTLHYIDADPDEVAREHRGFGARHADPFLPAAGRPPAHPGGPDRPLRVGYLSRDFREHAVACFIEPAITAHDRARCEPVCYADVARPDAVTHRIRAAAAAWRDVHGLTDAEVAALVRRDEIDVLVDLGGHTAHNRLLVFGRRPAPVQITYLGYPDTTGMAAMDYRVTDAEADPPGTTEPWHTERLVRLPGGAWCYRPPDASPDVGPLPAASSPRITFGSFNNFAKIAPETVALWAEVLSRVPGSCLFIKAMALTGEAARDDLRARFAQHGVTADRLDLAGWELRSRAHLATYGRVDIALDTYPYHGTTTTCEALWMGVPVVTLAGRTHASRVGASLLPRIGLARLVASRPDEFAAIAARLAGDRGALAALRAGLRDRMRASPLCDGRRLARELEDAYHDAFAAAGSC